MANEPGLMVINGLCKPNNSRKVLLTFVNMTNRHFTLNKGNVVGKVQELQDAEINEIVAETYEAEPCTEVVIPLIQKQRNGSNNEQERIKELLEKHSDIFAKHDYDLGRTNLIEAHIETGDARPIRKRMFRTPFAHREEVKRQIHEMLKAGLISPSNSPWSVPIFCVKKKDGSQRIVCDYRSVNDVTEKFYWPLPNIDEIFASLGGCRYFSTLDFIKGYMQIAMNKESKNKTAFLCEEGLFESNVLSFGLCNAPSTFQQCMAKLLNGASAYATAYLDDVIVFSPDLDSHITHLEDIFQPYQKG